jgi:hypothetical protein
VSNELLGEKKKYQEYNDVGLKDEAKKQKITVDRIEAHQRELSVSIAFLSELGHHIEKRRIVIPVLLPGYEVFINTVTLDAQKLSSLDGHDTSAAARL